MSIIFNFFLFILFSLTAQAAEYVEYNQSTRQLGMGGVYVFDGSASSFLQNPAYTCFTRGMNWTVANLGLGASIQAYNDYRAGTTTPSSISGLSSLTPYYGKNLWLGIGAHTVFTFPCFGFAAYNSGYIGLAMHTPPFPNLDMIFINDYGYLIGGALPLGPNLALGVTPKRITRLGGNQQLGTSTLVNATQSSLQSSFTNEGTGYGADVGLVSRFEDIAFSPTVSVGWKDVGSTAFIKSKGIDAPERQKDNLVIGTTFDGSIPLFGIAGGFEYRHVTDQGEPFAKKIHMGLEMSIAMFDVRAGFYQGYYTYGAGVDLALFKLDAALYTIERGAYAGQTPDQRVQISLEFDLGFDPNFKLLELGGRKRKLKQRR